jgi:hypothetical protein
MKKNPFSQGWRIESYGRITIHAVYIDDDAKTAQEFSPTALPAQHCQNKFP